MIQKIKSFFKTVSEEIQKIKFPNKSEVIGMSVSVGFLVIVSSIAFYLFDAISWFIVNKLIVGL